MIFTNLVLAFVILPASWEGQLTWHWQNKPEGIDLKDREHLRFQTKTLDRKIEVRTYRRLLETALPDGALVLNPNKTETEASTKLDDGDRIYPRFVESNETYALLNALFAASVKSPPNLAEFTFKNRTFTVEEIEELAVDPRKDRNVTVQYQEIGGKVSAKLDLKINQKTNQPRSFQLWTTGLYLPDGREKADLTLSYKIMEPVR